MNRIYRAFASLSLAVANSSNGTHLGTTILTGAGNYQLNWPCYNDGPIVMGASAEVVITGYTTGPANYIRVYTPVTSNEVGVSQRHRGVFGTGFRLEGTNADTIQIEDDYVRIEGLTIQATVTAPGSWGGIWSVPAAVSDIRISHNVIKNVVTAGNPSYGIALGSGASDVSRVWNNVVFNVTNSGGAAYGIGITIDYGFAYVFGNTIFNCETGIRKWPTGAGAEVRNNVAIHNTVANPGYVDYDQLAAAPAAVRSNNVSSDATSETVALRGKTAFATYFKNTGAGTEDLHITDTSLALWTSNGADLSANPNLQVGDDVDGGLRTRPDIGADEFGTCCLLSTAEVQGSTVTVTGAGQFELRFNAATGGGIDRFFDLAEDPTRSNEIGGATANQVLLFEDEIETSPTYAYPDDPRGLLHLLEATATRVKVRQDASYFASGGGAQLAGVRGVGDYAVYPAGKMAIAWRRKTTTARPYTALQLNFTTRYQAGPPYNAWADYSQSGLMGPTQPGDDDFVLLQSEVPGVRTDFLAIMNTDWAGRTAAEEVFSSYDSGVNQLTEATWHALTAGTLPAGAGPYSLQPGEAWNFLTYFKPTNFVDNVDPGGDVAAGRLPDRRHARDQRGQGQPVAGRRREQRHGRRLLQRGRGRVRLQPRSRARARLQRQRGRHDALFAVFQDPPVALGRAAATITVDGVTKTRDVHYKADVKPISFSAFAGSIVWHSTLENAAALTTTPDIGSGGTVGAGVTYRPRATARGRRSRPTPTGSPSRSRASTRRRGASSSGSSRRGTATTARGTTSAARTSTRPTSSCCRNSPTTACASRS